MGDTLFTDASVVLEGHAQRQPRHVLVRGDRIALVSAAPIAPGDARVIDVAGRTLMPGLIDAHAHVTGLSLSPRNLAYPESAIAEAAGHYLRQSLRYGFTTLREAGGADHRIARLLDTGAIVGPRLFYSGRALTQTGGGADFRTIAEDEEPAGHPSPFSVMSVIVDGVDEVRRAAREELRRGASQLKLFASGGVVFPSAGHATRWEFSEAELRAAVEEAEARGTYVMAHAYTDDAVRRCVRAGVRSIEHANFVSEATVALMAERGTFLVPTFISLVQRIESAPQTGLSDTIVAHLRETVARGRQVYAWARRHGVPIGLGTDLWGPDAQRDQLRELALRADLDAPADVIRSATTTNAALLMRSGELGVVAPGAHADLLLVDGDPLADLAVLTRPESTLKLVMRGGVVCSDALSG